MEHLYPSTVLLSDLTTQGVMRVLGWSLALVAVVVVGMAVVSRIKRSMQHSDEPVSAGFTLSDLRQLHKTGQMSDEEFERAKARIIDAAKRAAERQEASKAGTEGVGRTRRPDGLG